MHIYVTESSYEMKNFKVSAHLLVIIIRCIYIQGDMTMYKTLMKETRNL
jgi:hypothetical protein